MKRLIRRLNARWFESEGAREEKASNLLKALRYKPRSQEGGQATPQTSRSGLRAQVQRVLDHLPLRSRGFCRGR